MKRIAIIGAGISGLTLAHELSACAEIMVFEKARGVGGRMSTRYADAFSFDHGAQFFTARSAAFQAFLKPYIAIGTMAEWAGKVITLEAGQKQSKRLWFEPHWVATPNMNSLCKALARDVEVRTACEIAPLNVRENRKWHLTDKDGTSIGVFDWIISTAPPEQTLRLFGNHVPHDDPLREVSMQGCYALMLGFDTPWEKQWIAAHVQNNPIQWIAVNSSKPGRNNSVTSVVVHSTNSWAEAHMDDDIEDVQAFLLNQFSAVTGMDAAQAVYCSTHRWRYAIADNVGHARSFVDKDLGLAATGDWCETSRIETAWQYACLLAQEIKQEM